MSIVVTLPLKTVSRKNSREHWSKRAKRTSVERTVTRMAIRSAMAKARLIPQSHDKIVVTLTRVSPGELDKIDNLSIALSAVRDGVADAFGTTDRDPRVQWEYAQEKTKRFTAGKQAGNRYGVRICIEPLDSEAVPA